MIKFQTVRPNVPQPSFPTSKPKNAQPSFTRRSEGDSFDRVDRAVLEEFVAESEALANNNDVHEVFSKAGKIGKIIGVAGLSAVSMRYGLNQTLEILGKQAKRPFIQATKKNTVKVLSATKELAVKTAKAIKNSIVNTFNKIKNSESVQNTIGKIKSTAIGSWMFKKAKQIKNAEIVVKTLGKISQAKTFVKKSFQEVAKKISDKNRIKEGFVTTATTASAVAGAIEGSKVANDKMEVSA